MALNDDALFTAAVGYILIAPAGTTKPTPANIAGFDPDTGLVGWSNIGHTSRDELPEFGFEGGEAETRGTWQNASLREVITEATVDYVTFNLHQWDDETLELFYSQANASSTEGEFEVLNAASSTLERALTMVIVDGDAVVGFYARKASLRREGSIELATDGFAMLPIRATFLKDGSNALFSWISSDMGLNPGS